MRCSSMILMVFVFFCQFIAYSWQTSSYRCPSLRLYNGRVRPRARGRIVRFTCNDGFILVGNRYSTCVRGQWDTPTPVCVNAMCPKPNPPAHSVMGSKLDGAILMFFCEPGYSLIGSPEIYCNGYQWNGTVPFCRGTNTSAPTKCDFETPDICWWEPDPYHDFNWQRHNFETPSMHVGTGPTHDHTLGAGNNGYYLFIEASGRLVNDTARIISPLYNSSLTESGCFSLWYHMYGFTMGSLNVYFKREDSAPQLMFSKSGNQGNQWLNGIFNLPKSNVSFQIIIEGVRGASYVSDIAIDDVAILQGDECDRNDFTTSVTANDYDQIELVNAQQTCRNRCVFSTTESTVFSTKQPTFVPEGPEPCLCTIDCADRSLCCPDYAEYCILGYTGTIFDSTTKSASNITTLVAPVRRFSINPKDEIDPDMPNSTHYTLSTVNRTVVIFVTKKYTTKKFTTTTYKPQTKKTRTTKPTPQVETKETPFEFKTTTRQLETTTEHAKLQDQSDQRNAEQNPEKVKHRGSIEVLEIVAAVGATLFVLFVALAITIIVIRRRKSYKRGTNGSALSEDSDVRFLTSDEILDFNLARPTDNDDM